MLRWECLTCKCKASTLPDRPRSIVSLENIRGFNNNNLCLLISTLISRKMHGMAPMLSPGFCSSCVGLVLSKQHIVGCGLSVSVRHGSANSPGGQHGNQLPFTILVLHRCLCDLLWWLCSSWPPWCVSMSTGKLNYWVSSWIMCAVGSLFSTEHKAMLL